MTAAVYMSTPITYFMKTAKEIPPANMDGTATNDSSINSPMPDSPWPLVQPPATLAP
uniref:Uncharacterized protein n=1 Tax=Arion vulgaris TaxID=1028688 RepID=A0A0B6Y7S9_9EUPU